jgi:hypothetical protein
MAAPQTIRVALPPEVAAALRTLARREYRDPHGQAAYLLAEGLRRRGVLPRAQPPSPSQPRVVAGGDDAA